MVQDGFKLFFCPFPSATNLETLYAKAGVASKEKKFKDNNNSSNLLAILAWLKL